MANFLPNQPTVKAPFDSYIIDNHQIYLFLRLLPKKTSKRTFIEESKDHFLITRKSKGKIEDSDFRRFFYGFLIVHSNTYSDRKSLKNDSTILLKFYEYPLLQNFLHITKINDHPDMFTKLVSSVLLSFFKLKTDYIGSKIESYNI